MSGPRRTIIDTDPGHGHPGSDVDDGLVIALASRGRTEAWDADDQELLQVVVPLPRSRPVEIARGVDNDRLLALLLDRLSR